MKKTNPTAVIMAAIGLLAFASGSLQAQDQNVGQTFKFSGTARTQGTTTVSGGVTDIDTDKLSFNTDDILELIGDALGIAIPEDSKLVFRWDWPDFSMTVVDDDGLPVATVTSFFTLRLLPTTSGWIRSGTFGPGPGERDLKVTQIAEVTFNDGRGNKFSFYGKLIWKIEQSEPEDDEYEVEESISLSGENVGTVAGELAICTGEISGNGDGTFLVP